MGGHNSISAVSEKQELRNIFENLKEFSQLKCDPKFYIYQNYQDILTKIDLRREIFKIEHRQLLSES